MFKLFNRIMSPLYAVEAPAGPAGGVEDIIDILNDNDDVDEGSKEEEVLDLPKEKKEEKKDDKEEKEEEQKEEEVDELAELEEDLEEPSEEKLELDTPVPRREILKKYPKIFEDFPYLEKAYYRDREYTKYFETPAMAAEAVEKAETLDKFDNDLRDGNITNILKAAKEEGSLGKVADNYMDMIAQVDEKAYGHILTNVFRHLTNQMLEHSSEEGQEVLKHAAAVVNQFVFGSTKFAKPGKLATDVKPDEEKEDAVSEKEKKFMEKQFNTSRESLNTKVNNRIRNTIKAHIDPKSSMSDYVRGAASRDVYDKVVDLIDRDQPFKKLVNRLWDAVFKADFSESSLKRIEDAYSSKARTLLPSVIKKARADALKGINSRKVEKDDEDDEKGESTAPKNRRRKESSPSADKYKDKSTLQALMEDD